MKNSFGVAIILATYNGQKYLDEQMSSILGQTCSGFTLYLRDDGSCDRTIDIVESFITDDRVNIIPSSESLSVVGNFEVLLCNAQSSGADYIFLSDQDDVWFEGKVECQLKLMQKMEKIYGKETPLLVYSDLEIVNQTLGLLHRSFMEYQGIHHEENALSVLLPQNFVTGCTVMVNRQLLDIALPIPEEALMHDWWLALCAAVFGHIGYIAEPLVKYRQHGNNEVGAKHLSDFLNPMTGAWKQRWLEGRDNLFQSMKQAEALAERIRKHDPENSNLALVEAYASLQGTSRWQRIKKIKQLGVHAQSNSRQALLLSRLLLTSKAKYG